MTPATCPPAAGRALPRPTTLAIDRHPADPRETDMTAIVTRPPAPTAPPTGRDLLRGTSRRSAALPRGEELLARASREKDREELRRVRSLAAVVAVACVEAEAGRRPLRDLSGWLDPEAYEKMCRRVDLLERTGTRPSTAAAPRPVGARVCEVAPGRLEASATVVVDGRARAFALRVERRLSRWKVTALEAG